MLIVVIGLALTASTGCSSERKVVGKWVAAPTATVEAVELLAASPEATTTANVIVRLSNPNDTPLPLPMARYTVTMGGATYSTDTVPNATIPAKGEQRIALPVTIAGPQNHDYSTSGWISYLPPGEIRNLMTDIGIPLPGVPFSGSGEAVGAPAPVAVVAVGPIASPKLAPAHPPIEVSPPSATEVLESGQGEPLQEETEAEARQKANEAQIESLESVIEK